MKHNSLKKKKCPMFLVHSLCVNEQKLSEFDSRRGLEGFFFFFFYFLGLKKRKKDNAWKIYGWE